MKIKRPEESMEENHNLFIKASSHCFHAIFTGIEVIDFLH